MFKFIPGHLKAKEMCKHAVKKLPFPIRYVPDGYKTQQMSDKVIVQNGGMLEYFLTATKINKCVIKLLIITLMH